MTSTASACDVPNGWREMLTGSSIRALPSVQGTAFRGPPTLQPIPRTATRSAATNSAPDKPRWVVAISTPATAAPPASPAVVWMSSSRSAVAMWVSPATNSCCDLTRSVTDYRPNRDTSRLYLYPCMTNPAASGDTPATRACHHRHALRRIT